MQEYRGSRRFPLLMNILFVLGIFYVFIFAAFPVSGASEEDTSSNVSSDSFVAFEPSAPHMLFADAVSDVEQDGDSHVVGSTSINSIRPSSFTFKPRALKFPITEAALSLAAASVVALGVQFWSKSQMKAHVSEIEDQMKKNADALQKANSAKVELEKLVRSTQLPAGGESEESQSVGSKGPAIIDKIIRTLGKSECVGTVTEVEVIANQLESLKDENVSLRSRFEAAEDKLKVAVQNVKAANDSRTAAEASLSESAKKIVKLEEDLSTSNTLITQLKNIKSQSEKELQQTTSRLSLLKKETGQLETKVTGLVNKASNSEETAAVIESINALKGERESVVRERDALRRSLAESTNTIHRMEKEVEETNKKLDNLKHLRMKKTSELSDTHNILEAKMKEASTLQDQVDHLQTENSRMTKTISHLTERIAVVLSAVENAEESMSSFEADIEMVQNEFTLFESPTDSISVARKEKVVALLGALKMHHKCMQSYYNQMVNAAKSQQAKP